MLIVQTDWLIEAQSSTVVVLPMTTVLRDNVEELRVTIAPREGLRSRLQVVVEQPRTLDRQRLGRGPIAMLNPEEMARVEDNLLAVVGVFR